MADPLDDLVSVLGYDSTANDAQVQDDNLLQFKKNRQQDAQNAADQLATFNTPRRGGETTIQPQQLAALLRAPGAGGSIGSTQDDAARVNENTDKYGVKAVTDEKGNITLTNVGVVPATPVYPTAPNGVGPGTGSISPNTPLSVGSLFNQLKSTNEVDTARGIAASLREASAVQQAQYEQQAQQFASNKLGIPQLQKELQAAIAADMSDPKYRPGMGDSPITARIRAGVNAATDQAAQESKAYLNNNASYAVLKSTMVSAEAELARITRLGDRKDQMQLASDMRLADAKQRRQDILTEQGDALDPVAKQRMLMLNPELQNVPADELSAKMASTVVGQKANKEWMTAVQAPEESLTPLALSGNQYATRLITAKEEANTGIAPEQTLAKLESIRSIMATPGELQKKVAELYGGTKEGKKKAADFMEAYNQKNLSADGKAQAQLMKYEVAMQIAKKATTTNFENSLGNWKVSDPLFQDAVTQTRQVTGRANMIDVLHTYVGKATGPEAVLKYQAFADLAEAEARKSANSIFGMPSVQQTRAKIQAASRKSWLDQIQEGAAKSLSTNPLYEAMTTNPFDFGQKKQDLNQVLDGTPVWTDPNSL